jgi:hypothetical protein
MKITSRPAPDVTVGRGSINLKVTVDQAELIIALIMSCRLGGKSVYSAAAYQLCGLFENEFDPTMIESATDSLDLGVTVDDALGTVLYQTGPSGAEFVTLEV